ncbi:MAG: fibronectin type III domain-containing protein [Aquihabitans sp.]
MKRENQSVRRGVVLVLVAVLAGVLPLSAGLASAQAAPPPKGPGNVSPRLEELASVGAVATSDAAENRSIDLPAKGAGSLLHQPDGTFLANVRLASVDASTQAALTRAGARITARSVADHLVTVAIDPTEIDAVAAVAGVEWLEEVLAPSVGHVDLQGVADSLAQDGVTTSASCATKITSEGDTQLGAATARSTYGIDGTGIKIGVLSDSYNNLGGAAADVTNGELPGTDNPCGYTTPVVLQSDKASGGTDEGRAMAQAVHDLAPGATIMVATAFNGDVDFAQQIRNLAAAGAKVIVDDISYFNEPVYQDGIIAKAIADVTAAGVTYFSSAANSNIILGGREVASYEAASFRPTTCPSTITSSAANSCHDWDPGAGTDAGNLLTVNNGGQLQIKLGYSEPQYGITSDLDLFLLDNSTNAIVAQAVVDNVNSSKQAYELLTYTNSSGATKTYRLVVGRYAGGTPRFKAIIQNGSGLTAVQWNTTSGTDVIGPTSYGHNMMRGAGSIAAIRYNTTTAPETFSSRGPATYCWNPVVGTTAATALASCQSDTIDVAATDGAANSFFGQLSSGTWRFYGTSQAAPHAAAVAVLQLAARPCRTPAEILAAQRSSGLAVGSYGVDAVGGGRVNASGAIAALASCQLVPDAPTGVTGTPGNAKVTLSWTTPANQGASSVTGYRVTPYIGATAQTPVVFNSTATTQDITGLTNGTAYTFKVAATNGSGTGADSTASAAITPRTVPGAPTGVNGTAGDSKVTLSWTAPGSNGGSAVTGYTVTPYIGASAQTPAVFNSTGTTQDITGLTNGTAYTFKVAATNAAGTGADSAASAAITPVGLPGAPTAVSGNPGNGQVDLSWTAPVADGGSPITGYVVTPFIGASAQPASTFNSTATAQTITGLTNGTGYTFKVAATTATGTGTASAASATIVPRTVPGAPTAVAGTPGDGKVDLSWTAPASNGGSVITGYTITPYIGATAQSPVFVTTPATTRSITGLANGTAYTFKVKATNAAGSGADSSASAPITPAAVPGAPTNVTGTPGDGQVDLSWTAPAANGSAITSYTVTPYIGATAQTPVVFASTATAQTITGLANGTAYTFKVKAANGVGTGADSAASAATTPRTVPGAPTGVSALPGDTTATVSWTAPVANGGSAVTGYTVTPYIGIVAQADRVFSTTATTQTITGLTNGTSYTFRVRATNAAGTGAESGPSLAVTPRTLPGAPTGVSGTPQDASVALTWTAPASDGGSDITGYTVTPFIGSTAQTPVVFASTATAQTITGLTNGTAYTFEVAATTAAGTGAASARSSAVTPRTVPGAPTNVTGTPGNASVGLSWTAPASNGGSAITGYTVTPYDGATALTPVVFSSAATSQTISGLTNGTAYTFKVKATNAAGTGPDSTASGPVVPRTVPGKPTGVTGTPGNGSVDLSWTAPPANGAPITGYTITPYIGATAQPTTTVSGIATTKTVTGLTNGTAYTFRVQAGSASGISLPSDPSAAITPRTVPSSPTNVTGTPGDGNVIVAWDAPVSDGGSAITGYIVTPFVGAIAQTPVTVPTPVTKATVTGLANGTAYTFQVKAVNAAGPGADSSASAPITPRTSPGRPTDVTATAGNAQAQVSWTAPTSNGGSPITGYRVIPAIAGVAQPSTTFDSTATTQLVTGLTNGTAYTFTVVAISAGGTSTPSDPSGAVTPRTVPGAPTNVTGTAGNAKVSLSWAAPASNGGSAVTGYTVTPYIGASAQTPVVFDSTATTQDITGLANGTAYTFRVKATNAAGTGADSAASAAITPVAPAAPWAPFSSWTAMVDRVYLDMLGRAPTASERSARVAQLTAGTLTPGGLVAALRLDPDNVTNVDPVTRLYRAYFLRIPDKGGLTFWIRQRRLNGKKLDAISSSFAGSNEFKTKYGNLSNRAFVELVYQNVLGRPGEKSGVDFWTSRLDRKISSRGQVMTGFSESNEYKTKQVSEVHVSVLFILLKGTAPTTAEFADLVAKLDAETTTPAAIAQAIIDSPAYAAKVTG